MLKTVGRGGQMMLGKRYAGQRFELEERANGELVLRPVNLLQDCVEVVASAEPPAFEIAEVTERVMPGRGARNARR